MLSPSTYPGTRYADQKYSLLGQRISSCSSKEETSGKKPIHSWENLVCICILMVVFRSNVQKYSECVGPSLNLPWNEPYPDHTWISCTFKKIPLIYLECILLTIVRRSGPTVERLPAGADIIARLRFMPAPLAIAARAGLACRASGRNAIRGVGGCDLVARRIVDRRCARHAWAAGRGIDTRDLVVAPIDHNRTREIAGSLGANIVAGQERFVGHGRRAMAAICHRSLANSIPFDDEESWTLLLAVSASDDCPSRGRTLVSGRTDRGCDST